MSGQVVEIVEDGRHLVKNRGFLVVEHQSRELGRVPLDDIDAVITTAHGLTYSNSLLVALAERNIPLVACGANHLPAAILWSTDANHIQAGRISDQARASLPTQKRLWTQIIRAKIEAQRSALAQIGASHEGFHLLARKVKSGDPENVEAQAARRYWPLFFGTDFRRNRDAAGINTMLNYAYTILRSGTARAIMAAGLHPSLGLAHRQRRNNFALADDLMEPFRPMADLLVKDLVEEGLTTVDKTTKPALARILITDMSAEHGASPVRLCLQRAAQSLAQCLAGDRQSLDLARLPLPLE